MAWKYMETERVQYEDVSNGRIKKTAIVGYGQQKKKNTDEYM